MSTYDSGSSIQNAVQVRWFDAFHALDASIPKLRPTDAHAKQASAQLDAEADGICYLLSAVNERRNELALPSMLPPDILARIFIILAALDPNPFEPFRRFDFTDKESKLGWITVTHVCRRWRNICLNQPSLWTYLNLNKNQPWDVFLERAKGFPLRITGYSDEIGPDQELIEPVLKHRQQIQKLALYRLRPSDVHELSAGLVGPLPLIQEFSLSAIVNLDESESLPSLHQRILSGAAPSLQRLELIGVAFPWGYGCSGLTTFHYDAANGRFYSGHPPMSHRFTHVISTLRLMPALKSLKLVDALPEIHAGEDLPHKLCLNHLGSLHIKGFNDSCWQLWFKLNTPSCTRLCVDNERRTELGTLVVSRLQAHFQTIQPPGLLGLQLEMETRLGPGFVKFRLSGAKGDSCEPDGHRSYSITLRACSDDGEALARQFAATVPLENVCDVDITGRIGDSQAVYDTFLAARSVTNLHLRDHGSEHMLKALAYSPPTTPTTGDLAAETSLVRDNLDNSHPASDAVLFPALTSLTCTSIDFIAADHGKRCRSRAAMERMLALRPETTGRVLPRLEIEFGIISEKVVRKWRNLVNDLVWRPTPGRGGILIPESS